MEQTGIWYGGDYYPEQWLDSPEILEKDMEYMKRMGINTVTLGVFSWSFLEPYEGSYRLTWLKETVDRLYENGIFTIMATPSAARPKWLSDRYPEVLRVDEARKRHLFGGRHNHCYTSLIYRQKVRAINRELAKEFKTHPGVIMWHISNEYGGECHCSLCQEAFRAWLKRRYDSIEELNRKWCTAFWSHTYQSFEQIESPSSIGESMLHGLNLDWLRFVTDQTADFAKAEVAALREAGAMQPSTVNLMYDYKGLNYEKLSKVVDVVSWDSYPLWHKEKEIITARDNGMQHDFMRCLKKKPFLMMETSPSATNWQGVSKLKRPGLLKLAGLQAIAHGSDSVLYFQIRQSRGGSEKFHGAVIDHYGGSDTRVWKECASLKRELDSLEEVFTTVVPSKAAVIYDTENRWALLDAQGPRNRGLYYHSVCIKIYSAIKKLGINVDVIPMNQSLEAYDLVVAPMLYLFQNDIEGRINKYVKNGGQFLTTYWSGIVDETDRCFLGGTPHGLMEVFGLRSMELDALYEGELNHMVPLNGQGKRYECRNLCDLVTLDTAEALFVYDEEFYKGYPAFTKNSWGSGTAYYVCSDADEEFYSDFFQNLVNQGVLKPIIKGRIPEVLEVTSRESEEYEYVFVQNFSDRETLLDPVTGSELKKGTLLSGTITKDGGINGYDTLVLKRTIKACGS